MKGHTLDALFFDYSGTLNDDREPVLEAVNRVLDDMGHPRLGMKQWVEDIIPEANTAKLLLKIGVKPREATSDVERYFNDLYESHYAQVKVEGKWQPVPYPDTMPVLQQLHEQGVQIAVISSHPDSDLKKEMHQFGYCSYVSLTLGGAARKKQEKIERALNFLGLDRSRVGYVGDHTADVDVARETGLVPLSVPGGYHPAHMLRQKNPYGFLEGRLYDLVNGKMAEVSEMRFVSMLGELATT